jgi:hypothetical protein
MDSNVYANLVALAQQSVANQMRFCADNQKLDDEFTARFNEGDDDGTDSDAAPDGDAGAGSDTDQQGECTIESTGGGNEPAKIEPAGTPQ